MRRSVRSVSERVRHRIECWRLVCEPSECGPGKGTGARVTEQPHTGFTHREIDLRRRWHQSHLALFETAPAEERRPWRQERLAPHAAEARAHFDALRNSRDLDAFQQNTDKWVRSFDSGYSGTGGQMIINQIRKMSPVPDDSVTVLLDALTVPRDIDDAVRKIRMLADHLDSIRVGAHPSAKRAPFVASYYWGLEDPDTWPVAWFKSTGYMAYCTGEPEPDDQGARYRELYDFVALVDGDVQRFEQVAAWWADTRPVVVNEVLCDRSAIRPKYEIGTVSEAELMANARALVAVSGHVGGVLEPEVAEAVGRTLKAHRPSLMWTKENPRGDTWVDWRVPGTYGLGVRIWVNEAGLAVGLRPYPDGEADATDRALKVIQSGPVDGFEVLAGGRSVNGRDVGFVGGASGEVIYGTWFDRAKFASLDVTAEVLRAARAVSPLVARLAGDEEPDPEDPITRPRDMSRTLLIVVLSGECSIRTNSTSWARATSEGSGTAPDTAELARCRLSTSASGTPTTRNSDGSSTRSAMSAGVRIHRRNE